MAEITIASREIGPGHPCWIVAELSANHLNEYAYAEQLVCAAKKAGADAVKVQAIRPDGMTLQSDKPPFLVNWAGRNRTLWDLYEEAAMPWVWFDNLKKLTESLGMIFFSTAFDCESVDFLESLNVPCHKVASFELTDLPLIRYMASKGKPIILSMGMAGISEILEAINAADDGRLDRVYLKENRVLASPCEVALLKCTSVYPASVVDANLRTIQQMRGYQFSSIPVGLSDHTLGIAVPVAVVALGACIIEKHICLDRSLGGPDAGFSLEPHEFKAMVEAVRTAEAALGQVSYGPTESEKPMLRYRRSLFVVEAVKAGKLFTAENVRSIRPADGLPPRHYNEVLGRKASRDIEAGTPLSWEMVK